MATFPNQGRNTGRLTTPPNTDNTFLLARGRLGLLQGEPQGSYNAERVIPNNSQPEPTYALVLQSVRPHEHLHCTQPV